MSKPETIPDLAGLQNLLKLHARKRTGGPFVVDSQARERLSRMIERDEPQRYRFVIQRGEPSSLSADELDFVICQIVASGTTVRRYRSGLAIESRLQIDLDTKQLGATVFGDVMRILDRSCPKCKSTLIQIEQQQQAPGWRLACRKCNAAVVLRKSH